MKSTVPNFTPILLGSDFNVYGMARSFYALYGQPVRAIAEQQLAPTRFSKIVDLTLVPGFSEDPAWITEMKKLKQEYASHNEPVILIGCSDGYAELIAKHKAELEDVFICPYVDYQLLKQLNNKESFYQLCDQYGLPYPGTKIISKADYHKHQIAQPFGYPVAVKPANSVEWLDIRFEGRKKAFIIHNEAEYRTVIGKIFDNGYQSDVIVQDFIPGDDSNMRVVNAYVDRHHQVKMMNLGHPLLEDPAPGAIGNYVAILPEYNEAIYQQLQQFLEQIEYVGYADFDLKWDERDHTYKVFEINLRQGRSSFYVTLNGCNLAQYLVDDYVLDNLSDQPLVLGNQDPTQWQLWLGVSKRTFKQYARKNQDKATAVDLIRRGDYGTTFWYRKDANFLRWLLWKWMDHKYAQSFAKYFHLEKG
ncbi:carboxylate--amine ligase [Fructilactobacillus myrtifloralis]|uniref:Carboxylate--amine ligase n=1 Tax=Fructilactobacillus myrtifloralis TaxID=2940301 RepID=A0ABY5BP12_9LACO|nr:carboxylate--amine ligase [Fructilactobacillus myrtifloralis]USS85219.1 carboxylate--amine ligase [Fructilactobacillus myrtifloralis]